MSESESCIDCLFLMCCSPSTRLKSIHGLICNNFTELEFYWNNLEEDGDIENLRTSKTAFPTNFFNKTKIKTK